MSYKIVVIGTSLGGLSALQTVLGNLPADFQLPVAIVQHRHKNSDGTLRGMIQESALLPVREVEDKDEILPGQVYLAPADYHLLVEPGYFALSTDEPVSYARPSIDVLFESAADIYGEQVIGVILTGANQDGMQGLKKIKARGGYHCCAGTHHSRQRHHADSSNICRYSRLDCVTFRNFSPTSKSWLLYTEMNSCSQNPKSTSS